MKFIETHCFSLPLSRLFCCLLVGFILSACAPLGEVTAKRFFWPLPVSGVEPKIEYLGFWYADQDLTKKVASGWIERTILGQYPPVALFQSPYWVAFLPEQRIAVSDTSLRQVLILDLQTSAVRALKDKRGEPYPFLFPMKIAVSADGEIFVVDSLKGIVVKFGSNEKEIESFGSSSLLNHPLGIAVNSSDRLVYVVDVGQHNIAVFDLAGNLLYKIGERGSQPGQFNFPTDIQLDEEGNIYVVDSLNYRVQVFNSSGRFVREFGELGTEVGSFRMPKGIAVSPLGQIYVTDVLAHKVVVFDRQGRHLLSLGGKEYALASGKATPGGFLSPRGIATDASGRILVVDGYNKMIQQFQYLTADYLKLHPVLKNEIYLPPSLRHLQ